jgi:hypothetical protein
MEERGGYASAISLWELGIKVQRGKLELPITVEELALRIERGGVVALLPVDTTTWLRTLGLPWSHRDPADRVIEASALLRGVPPRTGSYTASRGSSVSGDGGREEGVRGPRGSGGREDGEQEEHPRHVTPGPAGPSSENGLGRAS